MADGNFHGDLLEEWKRFSLTNEEDEKALDVERAIVLLVEENFDCCLPGKPYGFVIASYLIL